jgi:hypothetical protein
MVLVHVLPFSSVMDWGAPPWGLPTLPELFFSFFLVLIAEALKRPIDGHFRAAGYARLFAGAKRRAGG